MRRQRERRKPDPIGPAELGERLRDLTQVLDKSNKLLDKVHGLLDALNRGDTVVVATTALGPIEISLKNKLKVSQQKLTDATKPAKPARKTRKR